MAYNKYAVGIAMIPNVGFWQSFHEHIVVRTLFRFLVKVIAGGIPFYDEQNQGIDSDTDVENTAGSVSSLSSEPLKPGVIVKLAS